MSYGCYSDYFLIYYMIDMIYDMVMVDMIDLTNSRHFYMQPSSDSGISKRAMLRQRPKMTAHDTRQAN